MPIFRYHCPACGKDFELLQPNSSAPALCPGCKSDKVERQLSRFAAVTKTGPAGCPARHDCPSAGGCGCGCGCAGHHHH